jgi:hypothetical protein
MFFQTAQMTFVVLQLFVRLCSIGCYWFCMASIQEQRTCVKFCVELCKTAVQTHRILCEAYGSEALSKMMTYKWHKHFKSRTSTDDDKRLCQPSTSKQIL